jgi:aminoglycoside phosphotransferase (APT) family kinase protein
VQRLLELLGDAHARLAPRAEKTIHGDPHAEQWLDQGQQLGLLDFESLARGDPELDVAVFLAELDFEDSLQVPVEQLESAFLSGVREVGVILDPARLVVYRAHKRLAKALRSARADGDLRAAAHLERTFECFGA